MEKQTESYNYGERFEADFAELLRRFEMTVYITLDGKVVFESDVNNYDEEIQDVMKRIFSK